VTGRLLVIQVPDASDVGSVAVIFGPVDRLVLRLERAEYVVGMILDHIVFDRASLRAPLRAWLYVDIGHVVPPQVVSRSSPPQG
jgi:hypothetical protein